MSNVYAFGVVTAEREEAIRQDVVDALKRCLDGAGKMGRFPFFLSEAINGRIWEHVRRLPGGTPVKPMSLHEFITTRYPLGLGIDHDTVKRLIAGDPVVMDLYDGEVKRGDGGANNPNRDPETGRLVAAPLTGNNIPSEGEPGRPEGTSAQKGLRRLRAAAETGDPRAQALHADVLAKRIIDGKKMTVNRACVEMGWRSPTLTVKNDPIALIEAASKRVPPLELAQRAWRMMSPEDRDQLLDWQSRN
jgi:hypothetical protein